MLGAASWPLKAREDCSHSREGNDLQTGPWGCHWHQLQPIVTGNAGSSWATPPPGLLLWGLTPSSCLALNQGAPGSFQKIWTQDHTFLQIQILCGARLMGTFGQRGCLSSPSSLSEMLVSTTWMHMSVFRASLPSKSPLLDSPCSRKMGLTEHFSQLQKLSPSVVGCND